MFRKEKICVFLLCATIVVNIIVATFFEFGPKTPLGALVASISIVSACVLFIYYYNESQYQGKPVDVSEFKKGTKIRVIRTMYSRYTNFHSPKEEDDFNILIAEAFVNDDTRTRFIRLKKESLFPEIKNNVLSLELGSYRIGKKDRKTILFNPQSISIEQMERTEIEV